MQALIGGAALYSASPILPPAAVPALPARGGAAGRLRLLESPRGRLYKRLCSRSGCWRAPVSGGCSHNACIPQTMDKLQGSEGVIPFHQASMQQWTGHLRTGLYCSIEGTHRIQGIEQGRTQGICD